MKAQRRHALQTNSLSQALDRSVEFVRQHGSRVILGVILVALVFILIYQRMGLSQQRAEDAQMYLSRAWDNIVDLQQLNRYPARPELVMGIASRRRQDTNVARDAIANVLKMTTDRKALAQLHVVAGQLNWELGNLPELPGATTRPELKAEREPDKCLDEAKGHYETILKDFSDQRPAVLAANLGLAAIAENRQDWDEARKQYEQVLKQADAPQWAKDLAGRQMGNLEQIRQPVLLATPATLPTAVPTTLSTTLPIAPTTLPTTAPKAAATRATREALTTPASQPTTQDTR